MSRAGIAHALAGLWLRPGTTVDRRDRLSGDVGAHRVHTTGMSTARIGTGSPR